MSSSGLRATPLGPTAGKKLVFHDLFTGAKGTPPAATRWSTYTATYDCWQRAPSQVALDGAGHLVITAEQSGDLVLTGGMNGLHPFTYGYCEARVKVSADPDHLTSGVLILWPHQVPWPQGGELDYYETGTERDPVGVNIHYGAQNLALQYTVPVDATDWHVFGIDWQPDSLAVWVDGKQKIEITEPAEAIPSWLMQPTIQLDALAANCKAALAQPVQMTVDYLEVWQ